MIIGGTDVRNLYLQLYWIQRPAPAKAYRKGSRTEHRGCQTDNEHGRSHQEEYKGRETDHQHAHKVGNLD